VAVTPTGPKRSDRRSTEELLNAADRLWPNAEHVRPLVLVLWLRLSPRPVANLRVVDPLLERTVRSAIPVREVLEVP